MFEAFFPSSPTYLEKETTPFRLPIQYLPKEDLHVLKESVATDLELVHSSPDPDIKQSKEESDKQVTKEQSTMYHRLFNPKTKFEENMIHEWGRFYTSNPELLKDSQKVIINILHYIL